MNYIYKNKMLGLLKQFLSKNLGLPENVCLPVLGIVIAAIVGVLIYLYKDQIKGLFGGEKYEDVQAASGEDQYEEVEEPFEDEYSDEDDFDMEEAFGNMSDDDEDDEDEDFNAIGNMDDEEMQSLGQL